MSPCPLHTPSPLAMCASLRHARKTLCRRVGETCAEPDDRFVRAYPAMVAAVEAGFRHEEYIMETLGFERLRDHRAENAVILSALHRVMPNVETGDCMLGRQVAEALCDVLALHRLHTDLAVAVAPYRPTRRLHGKAARATQHVAAYRRAAH